MTTIIKGTEQTTVAELRRALLGRVVRRRVPGRNGYGAWKRTGIVRHVDIYADYVARTGIIREARTMRDHADHIIVSVEPLDSHPDNVFHHLVEWEVAE